MPECGGSARTRRRRCRWTTWFAPSRPRVVERRRVRLTRDVSVRTSQVAPATTTKLIPSATTTPPRPNSSTTTPPSGDPTRRDTLSLAAFAALAAIELVAPDEPGEQGDLGRVVDPCQDGLDGGDEERRPDPVRGHGQEREQRDGLEEVRRDERAAQVPAVDQAAGERTEHDRDRQLDQEQRGRQRARRRLGEDVHRAARPAAASRPCR